MTWTDAQVENVARWLGDNARDHGDNHPCYCLHCIATALAESGALTMPPAYAGSHLQETGIYCYLVPQKAYDRQAAAIAKLKGEEDE